MKIIQEIKEILIEKAINNEIPSDMNELNEGIFDSIINNLIEEFEKKAEYAALDQYLSEYPKELSYDEIIDIISKDEEDLLDDNNIMIWEVVKHAYYSGDLVQYIENTKDCLIKDFKEVIS